MRILTLILTCFLLSFSMRAENTSLHSVRFNSLDTEGQISKYVKYLYQDSEGFIWIAANEVLARYDGQSIVSYPAERFIYDIIETDDRHLLVAADGRLESFDKTTGSFSVLEDDIFVSSLVMDGDGNVWAGGSGGLFRNGADEDHFMKVDLGLDDELPNGIIDLIEGPDGNIWMTTWQNGLYVYDPERRATKVFLDGDLQYSYILHKDSSGTVWVGTWGAGLLKLAPDFMVSASYERFSADQTDPNALLDDVIYVIADHGELLMVGGQKGLTLHDMTAGTFRSYVADTEEGSLPYNQVNSILVTRNSNIYLGLYGGGICSVITDTLPYSLDYLPDVKSRFSTNTVNSLCAGRDGHLWMGVQDHGFISYDPVSGSTRKYNEYDAFEDILSISSAFTIVQRRLTGEYCFGTYSEGLWVYDSFSESVKVYSAGNSSLKENNIISLENDNDGNLWIGTSTGAYILDSRDNLIAVKELSGDEGFPEDHVNDITVSDDGKVYLAMYGYGIIEVDLPSGSYVIYKSEGNGEVNFQTIYTDSRGNLWAGASDRGLYLLNRETGALVDMNFVEELKTESVLNLLEDHSGQMWMTTSDDIVSFVAEPDGKAVRVIGYVADLDVDFSRNVALKLSDEILFGTAQGLLRFSLNAPDRRTGCDHAVVIDDLQINGVSYKKLDLVDGDINYVESIQVSEGDNIEVKYTILDYEHYFSPIYGCSYDAVAFNTLNQSVTFKAVNSQTTLCLTADVASEAKVLTFITAADEENGHLLWIGAVILLMMLAVAVVLVMRKRSKAGTKPDVNDSIIFEISSANITSADKDLLDKTMEVIYRHIGDSEFKQADFIKEMGISRTQLSDKLKELTGYTPVNLMYEVRLKTAYTTIMSAEGKLRVSDVAYSVGFNDAKYFSTCFRKKYGMTPKELMQQRLETLNPDKTV